MTPMPKWMPTAAILATYTERTAALPRQSGASDLEEARAGNALRAFRRLLAAGKMDAELEAWLHEFVPGWKEDNVRPEARGMRGTRSFEARVAAAKRFRAAHGKLPSAASSRQEEAALGVFLRNCRQAAKGKGTSSWTLAKRLRLNRMLPGWDLQFAGGTVTQMQLVANA